MWVRNTLYLCKHCYIPFIFIRPKKSSNSLSRFGSCRMNFGVPLSRAIVKVNDGWMTSKSVRRLVSSRFVCVMEQFNIPTSFDPLAGFIYPILHLYPGGRQSTYFFKIFHDNYYKEKQKPVRKAYWDFVNQQRQQKKHEKQEKKTKKTNENKWSCLWSIN